MLAGASAIGGQVAIHLHEAQPPAVVAYGAMTTLAIGALAVLAATLGRQHQRRELARERERREALEALAASERHRLRAERLAELGRLAATVAHELNSPLAVVLANLAWLQRDPGLRRDEPAEVLRDALESAGQIRAAIARLGAAHPASTPEGAPGR